MRATLPPLILLILGLTTGCRTADEAIERYRTREVERFVILTTPALAETAILASFVELKRAQGLETTIVAVAASPTPATAIRELRRRVAERRPAAGELAYALIIGAPSEIPMPAWSFEGLDEDLTCDLPYFFESDAGPEELISEEAWSRAFDDDFPWVIGRIPFSRPELVARVLDATRRFSELRGPPRALLGAERWNLWFDSSLILSRARAAMADHGWQTTLMGEDAPCDLAIAGTHPEEGEDRVAFLREWGRSAPRFVYTLSHGGANSIGGSLVPANILTAKQAAIIKSHLPLFKARGLVKDGQTFPVYPSAPASPAIFFATGCSSGLPAGLHLRDLFEFGWICGFGGYTALSSPLPLFTALNAEVNTADVFAAGLPVGLALRALKETYLEAARGSPTYWALDVVRRHAARNVLASVYYGDPSLAVPRP